MKDTIVRSVKESQVMVDKADERLRREVAEKASDCAVRLRLLTGRLSYNKPALRSHLSSLTTA